MTVIALCSSHFFKKSSTWRFLTEYRILGRLHASSAVMFSCYRCKFWWSKSMFLRFFSLLVIGLYYFKDFWFRLDTAAKMYVVRICFRSTFSCYHSARENTVIVKKLDGRFRRVYTFQATLNAKCFWGCRISVSLMYVYIRICGFR
jgi:hypothetical protein